MADGFEANALSPAGRVQRDWWMLQRIHRPPRRARWLWLTPLVPVAVTGAASLLRALVP